MSNFDNSVGGIPGTDQRGTEQSTDQIHREGIQYVKEHSAAASQIGEDHAQGNGMTASSSSAPPPIREQPATSNPGADDPTGGIAKGAGGVSGSAHVESPVPNEEQGIINTVKSFLGLNISEEKKAEDTPQGWNAGEVTAMAGVGASAAAPPVAVAAATRGGNTSYSQNVDNRAAVAAGSDSPIHTRSTDTAPSDLSGAQPLSSTFDAAGQSSLTSGTTEPKPSTLRTTEPTESTGRSIDAGSHLSTGSGPDFSAQERAKSHSKGPSALGANTLSKSHADNTDADTEIRQQQPESTHEKSEHKPPKPADGKPSGKNMENPGAIPTAGGEKLGEKHWGESEIVPDNPKPRGSEAGISSSEGQPTSDVVANTVKNTGGASGGPDASAEKHGAVDKIKDKLHIGSKKE